MVPLDKLDEDQKFFLLNNIQHQGNWWIDGFPGSGKSVLLMHILAKIKIENSNAQFCCVSFTKSLKQLFIVALNELNIPMNNFRPMTIYEFMENSRNNTSFDYIFCDEVQDIPPSVINRMKNSCRVLYMSGDRHQSLYDRDPIWHEKVIDPENICNIGNANQFSLTTIHRLTPSVIKLVSELMPSMNILSVKPNSMKKDVSVRYAYFENFINEVKYVMENAQEAISLARTVAIIFPTHENLINFAKQYILSIGGIPWKIKLNQFNANDYDNFNYFMKEHNLHVIANGAGVLSNANRGAFILSTYHSVKGLDFDYVYLPMVTIEAKILKETVFMVALTRAKEALYISSTLSKHEYLEKIINLCHLIDLSSDKKEDEFKFDF